MTKSTLPIAAVLVLWTVAASAQPTQIAVGSTVESSDGQLAGAVDCLTGSAGGEQKLIVGLAGYLGAGDKNVAIPSSGVEHLAPLHQWPRHSTAGVYGGGSSARIKVPLTLKQMTDAPAYKVPSADAGAQKQAAAEPHSAGSSQSQSGSCP